MPTWVLKFRYVRFQYITMNVEHGPFWHLTEIQMSCYLRNLSCFMLWYHRVLYVIFKTIIFKTKKQCHCWQCFQFYTNFKLKDFFFMLTCDLEIFRGASISRFQVVSDSLIYPYFFWTLRFRCASFSRFQVVNDSLIHPYFFGLLDLDALV